jgi:hypothetical protein
MTGSGRGLGQPTDALLVPITLELSPIRRLLVIDVADDPTYRALEPQVLDVPDGSGVVLLAYRHDGYVELYAEPETPIDASGYAGLGKGLLGIHRTALTPGRFEVTDDGLQVDIAFTAPDGRRMDLHMHEHLGGPRDGVPVLAPVGGAFDSPEFFPFIWLPGLSFVPVRGTEVALRVDGEERTVSRLPLPIGGRRCLMARYDPDVMVCQVNPDSVTDVPSAPVRPSRPADGVEVVEVGGDPGIAGVHVSRGGHTCSVVLDPPLPDVARLPSAARREGTVRMQADGATVLQGRYAVARSADRIDLVIDQIGPWRTRVRRPLLAVLFRLPIFRRWPTTYRWQGTVELTDAGAPSPRWRTRWSRSAGS